MIDETYTETLPTEEELTPLEEPSRGIFSYLILTLVTLTLLTLTGLFAFNYLQTPPSNFPLNTPLTIELGTGTRQALTELKQQGYIRSELMLYADLYLNHKDKTIKASTYTFSTPLSVSELATALTEGNPASNLERLTLIEGESVRQVAARAAEVLPAFDAATFIRLAEEQEGRLFPETYLVPNTFTAEDLLELLGTTFTEKISTLETAITQSEFTLDEILILASILEREANTGESMRMVSGILQNRLSIGMALQVDASMEYVLDKPLSELTPEDLEIDSPYNTYLYPGLPPTPIGNPGLEAIEAILNPEPSAYMFYITGNDGEFYYARDFDEHRANIARYLR